MENNKPQQKPKEKDESCRIRIKNTKQGKEISFHGNCSKQQIGMAHGSLEDLED